MEARIRAEYPDATVELIPSGGGVFEVVRDGTLIYSKKRTGRHAEWEDVAPGLGGNRES
jgi:predicted Rdx family selenoprotein